MTITESDIIDQLLRDGLEIDDLNEVLARFSENCVAHGIPLLMTGASMPAIDPTSTFVVCFWWRKGHAPPPIPPAQLQSMERYRKSPVYDLLQRNVPRERWRLDDPVVATRFPIFETLRQQGGTEYALSITPFSGGRTALRGAAMAMATDQPGGFTQEQAEFMARVSPALALAAYRIGLLHVATETLGAYLGRFTGGQVMQGMIHRGDSRNISAALLLTDLRGFTAMVDGFGTKAAIGFLNEHLEAMADPVAERGGEVLKFLGDGLLAVFPAAEDPDKACAACVAAAKEIKLRTTALNAKRSAGEPHLDASLVLHFGEVVYGNIGAADRLDFTIIGQAVNEASRMELLAKQLGKTLLSASFAERCGHPVVSIGHHSLRGVAGTREIFELAEDGSVEARR
jgi:adenylate cyclase